MTDWAYIITGLSTGLLVFLIWKEISRPNKARLWWRILATLFAVISLAAIALPIHYHHTKTISPANEAILLTEGYNADSVSHFLRQKGKNIPVYTLDEGMVTAKRYDARLVTDPDFFTAKNLIALHVFGYGPEKEEAAALEKLPLVWHAASRSTGITSIHWRQRMKAGEKLYVQGSFENKGLFPKKIVLTGFQTTLDSAIIPAHTNQPFQLTTIPEQLGRLLYHVAVVDNKDTIEKEPLPVQVQPGQALQVLMLASSPDFENKFLKNWLAQKGYAVVVRTAISKNKFEKEYINIPVMSIDHISSSLLNKFSIIIADQKELSSISKPELQTLQTGILQENKGLIIKADSAGAPAAFYAGRFPIAPLFGGNINQQPVNLHLIDSSYNLQTLSLESPLYIQALNGTQPLVMDKENRVYVNSTVYGSGKMVYSTLSNTYSWVLSGNQNDYDNLWSEILNKALPENAEEESWHVSPALPQINQPVTLSLHTNHTAIPEAATEGATVYLGNDENFPFIWNGTYWPVKEGWQAGIQLNGAVYYWYAYATNNWKQVQAYDKMQIMQTYTQGYRLQAGRDEPALVEETIAFPAIYFFLIFLISGSFLWFENKYYVS